MFTKYNKFKTALIFICFFSAYILVIAKLYFIQIRNTQFFTGVGKQQYHITITAKPPRACIFDRTGKQALALNKDSISAFTTPNNIKEPQLLHSFLQTHFPSAYDRLLKQKKSPFMYIKRRITPAERTLLLNAHIPDIHFLNEPSRFYPVESTGHIIGTTDIDNNGNMGVELFCNSLLAGSPSSVTLDRDARSGNFYFKKEVKSAGKIGTSVALTLDSTLQFLAYQELEETVTQFKSTEGSAIIMNPCNGDILAMVTYPDFDPQNMENINLDHTRNKIVTDTYEFGSVMKTFFALAAIYEKVVTPDTLIDCKNTRSITLGGMRINTVKENGIITFSQVIQNSNNIGTAQVALMLGDKLYTHYKRCGFSAKTGITFPGEQAGLITHPRTWSKQSLASLSYGYEITATLLQLACAFCMIAQDGKKVTPRLIMSPACYCKEQPNEQLYPAETISVLKEMLKKTITEGSASKARINGYTIMGKTGTANLLINGKYQPNHNIFTFAGIVEKGNYKRVIVTFIKEAQQQDIYASTVTAPLFEKIAKKMLIHDKVV